MPGILDALQNIAVGNGALVRQNIGATLTGPPRAVGQALPEEVAAVAATTTAVRRTFVVTGGRRP